MRRWLGVLGLDRAIAYSLLLKSWQTIAGLVGMALIATHFDPQTQGFYYTFASLIALQSFFELGLHFVVSNFASHEWAKLRVGEDGTIDGDPQSLSRLVSLGRFVFKWYAVASLGFLVFAGGGGYWFLGRAGVAGINWQGPWIAHIVFSALQLWCLPFLSLLEGCNQVGQVARFKTWQTIGSNFAIWFSILLGAGLWAVPAFSLVSLLFSLYYLLNGRKAFFRPFFSPPASAHLRWREEILPMQWRLAIQGMTSYFVLSLFTPVMFYYHGPTVAGQMGMTWQIVSAIQAVATIWVTTNAPKFGMLVATREFPLLDSSWRKATFVSIALMMLGVTVTFLFVYYFSEHHWGPMDRLLPPLPFLLLAVGALFGQAGQCFAIYLRAHKREVLLPAGIVTGILMGLSVWQLGMAYGALGASAAYLLVTASVTFPMAGLIWMRSRRQWHGVTI